MVVYSAVDRLGVIPFGIRDVTDLTSKTAGHGAS
jgi:hypothetical protein